MRATYLQLRAKGLGGEEMGVIPLSSLTQIADVVLVHDEGAMEDELRARGLAKLVGYQVQAYDGTPMGKVCTIKQFSCPAEWKRCVCVMLHTLTCPDGCVCQ